MMIFKTKKLQQVRKSYFILLPPEWIASNNMKKSDPVRLILLDDGNIKISPVPQPGQGIEGTRAPTTDSRSVSAYER